jgi:hypothetical protein
LVIALLLYDVKLTTPSGERKTGQLVVPRTEDVRETAEQVLIQEGVEARIDELTFVREM